MNIKAIQRGEIKIRNPLFAANRLLWFLMFRSLEEIFRTKIVYLTTSKIH